MFPEVIVSQAGYTGLGNRLIGYFPELSWNRNFDQEKTITVYFDYWGADASFIVRK